MAKKPAKAKAVEVVGLPATFEFPGSEQLEQPAEVVKKEPWEEKLEAVSKSFEEREKKYADQIDRLYGMLTSVASQPAVTAPVVAAAPKAPVLDLAGLPDPTMDAAGYNRGLQDRVQKFASDTVTFNAQQAAAAQAPAAAQASMNARIDALWNKFSDTYKDLAGQEDFVQLSAQGILQDVAAMGGNVEQFIFRDPDRFLAKVAEKAKERLTALGWKPEGAEVDEDEDEAPGGDAMRTAVVTGQHAGQPARAAGATTVGQPMNLAQEVLAWQRNAKLI